MNQTFNWKEQPTQSGDYWYRPNQDSEPIVVEVTFGPSSGIACKELKQGGSIHCGFGPWEGQFSFIQNDY